MLRPKNCKKCGGKMQTGGLQLYTQANTPMGATTTTGQSSLAQNAAMSPAQIQALAQQFGFRTDNNQNLQTDLFNYAQVKQPSAYDQVMQKYGQTNAGTFADGLLGARTTDLLSSLVLPQPPQPQPQKAALTEHFFGPNEHALGMASQRYRDSQAVTDPGIVNTAAPQEWVDFQYYLPESTKIDESRGRYKIPNSVWQNQIARGTNRITDPTLLDQYRVDASNQITQPNQMMASNPIKMRGGYLQSGGRIDLGNYNQLIRPEDVISPYETPYQYPQQTDRVQEAIDKGILDEQINYNSAQDWYNNFQGMQNPQNARRNPYDTIQQVGIGMQAARTGLGWLAGAVERGRQNQYDMQQQTALGMMNPMPADDFQPNPYNLYMMKGGKLKTIMDDYNKWSNNAGPMDMTHGQGNPEMKKGGYEIDRMLVVRKILPELLKMGRLGSSKYRSLQKGGTNPSIYTSNPKDPRLQAYQDSAEAYNIWKSNQLATEKFLQQKYGDKAAIPTRTPLTNKDNYQIGIEYFNKNEMMPERNFIDRYMRHNYAENPVLPINQLEYTVPSSNIRDKRWYIPEYKEPVQPVKLFTPITQEPAKKPVKQVAPAKPKSASPVPVPAPVPAPRKEEEKKTDTLKRVLAARKGGIHIKPENKGKFTEYCGGKVTDECIEKGLNSSNPVTRKRANFARNARKWN